MKRTSFTSFSVAASLLLVFGLFAFVPLSAASDFFLHSTTNDFLDNTSPTATTAKFKDSAAVNRTTYQEIGTWAAAPAATWLRLSSLSDLHVWIGLKNSDDQGTYFDLRAELRKNGMVIASGETKNIQGVTRNPANAKEVALPSGPIFGDQFNPGDVLSIKILTKVADSGGHNNAVGLRLYYDAVSRPSRFGAVFENIEATEIVPPEGGTVQVQGFASITFPPGSFPSNNPVKVSVTATAETHEDFSATAEGPRLPYEIRINSGNVPPATTFDVVLNVPESFVSSLAPDHQLEIFAQPIETGATEALGHFHGFPSTFDATINTVRATLPPEAFTDENTADGSYEAVLIVGDIPKYPPNVGTQGSRSGSPIKSAKANPLMLASLNLFSLLAEGTPVCEGSPLGNPLEGPVRQPSSQFNPPLHTGVDYPGAQGENVHPVLPGRVTKIGFDLRQLPRPNPRTGLMVRGWGRYVVITHNDGSQTLYAHLIPESTNHLVEGVTEVAPTDVIGQVGVSGGVTGPHLHLEYSPEGRMFVKRSLVDPDPCILAGQAPPEPLVLSPQNPTFSCSNPSLTFTASGGTPPYTWSTNKGKIEPSADTKSAVLTPPDNPAANPESPVPGVAYRYNAAPTRNNAAQHFCADPDLGIAFTLSFDCKDQNLGCSGISAAEAISQGAGISCWSFDSCPGLQQCTNFEIPFCNANPDIIRALGVFVNRRTSDMLAAGCKPCRLEMEGGATVTVEDANPNQVPVTTTVTVQ